MDTDKQLSTVYLDSEKCKGCVTCMKRCPTDAIRVRDGKASVLYSRCIGCGECIRQCPYGAKQAAYDPLSIIDNYKYKVALVPPSFYGQFGHLKSINKLLSAIMELGFTDIFEVGASAELVSDATMKHFQNRSVNLPAISTACPAVVELIYDRFGSLVGNLVQILTPVDVAAKLVREKYDKLGFKREDVGIFFISPCPAKVYALKTGLCVETKNVDGVLSVQEVYKHVQPLIKNAPETLSTKVGIVGMAWSGSGGESTAVMRSDYLAADGIENVIKVLNSIEDGQLKDIEFVELNACVGGCVGGVLNVENPFVARARIRELRKKLPYKVNYFEKTGKPLDYYNWESKPEHAVKQVDRQQAMSKVIEYSDILATLPGINCGICGAPSCSAFADDIASGRMPKDSKCPLAKDKK